MRFGPAHPRGFFERSCLEVAPALIGAYMVRRLGDGTRLAGRIVEVEAYLGDGSDPGSHCHRGLTRRNRAMFGPPGRLYVYRIYGVHTCANVVCEAAGRGAAVLLRAVEPVLGTARMRALRELPQEAPLRTIASGPGNLCRAFDLRMSDYGASMLRGPICLRSPRAGDAPPEVATSRRIGLSQGSDLPFRFYAAGNPCVGRKPPAREPDPGRA